MEELRERLMNGRTDLPRVGSVEPGRGTLPPYVVVDESGAELEPVTRYLRDLALSDMSPLTCRGYGFDLLRWFRVLWALDVVWEQSTQSEADVMVGWMRTAVNPQRERRRSGGTPAGMLNLRTGKPALAAGYAPRTINHALSAVHGFYSFHGHLGRGPVVNPVPSSRQRRRALGHRSPVEARAVFRRARLRQRVADVAPRALTDARWDELFAVMTCDRDRAVLLCYVSSGARANELLGAQLGDVDWGGLKIYVVSKGTRLRQALPASPEAFLYLARYLDADGMPAVDDRRPPEARAAAERPTRGSRFAVNRIDPKPGVAKVAPRPFGELSRAPLSRIVDIAGTGLGSQLDSPRQKRRWAYVECCGIPGSASRNWSN
ncbi:site-specific integrase [Actinoplanes sp. RD1]|uniref:hypothetical protein n=1 Tax=Actinoplanes sp. RD1 TaxID=3064538 RepID=UPI002741D838|nr:hypothetical protein [Actinoplanes sp. RD1]